MLVCLFYILNNSGKIREVDQTNYSNGRVVLVTCMKLKLFKPNFKNVYRYAAL